MPQRPSPRVAAIRRRRATLLIGVLVGAVVILAIVLATGGGGDGLGDEPAPPGSIDPLGYDPDHAGTLERLAAAGLSHVLYAKSPGGAVASAARTLRFRDAAERAAQDGPVDADTLLGIVMLESAGRPDAVAGSDPSAAAGLTQILAETGQDLLGMHIDLAASRRYAHLIAKAREHGRERRAAQLEAKRARVDERFDPEKALAATERYLRIAEGHLHRQDLAIASYHMGIGNLQTALRRYRASGARLRGHVAAPAPAGADPGAGDVPYVQLFFDSTPLSHPQASAFLASLGDDSRTYLWRVLAAKEILRLAQKDPEELVHQALLQTSSDSAARALRPDPAAAGSGEPLPATPAAHGILAPESARLQPLAARVARDIGTGVRAITGAHGFLGITRASGYSFDVARDYTGGGQAQAFQFMLDRLQALNAIAYERRGQVIHIVVGPDARLLK